MANQSLTIDDVIREAKVRIAENKLTLKEIADNVPMDEELLSILLDEKNGITKSLSDLVNFMRINITGTRHHQFITHRFVENDDQIKVIRVLHPKCSIVYDKVGKKLYNFKSKNRSDKISDHHKQLIINEMATEVEKYVKIRR